MAATPISRSESQVNASNSQQVVLRKPPAAKSKPTMASRPKQEGKNNYVNDDEVKVLVDWGIKLVIVQTTSNNFPSQ